MSTYLTNLSNTNTSDYSLWKATKRLKRPINQQSPIRKLNGNWARNDKEKAERFAEHLENIFQPPDCQYEEILGNVVDQECKHINSTSCSEVMDVIKNLKNKKAPGFDLITAEVLKQLPRKAIIKFTKLINATLKLKHVPKLWKVAEVIMILKSGKPPQETTSYRPISLLPVISKVFEKILLKRLIPIIEEKGCIPNHQFGFRSKHSTIDQVHRITNVIEEALEMKQVCSTVFLDVAQAFDKVWHEGLNYKLRTILPKQYSDILESYITERYFRAKQENEYSDLKRIMAGVPQGSVLGPLLYLLYTCDIPTPLEEENVLATFADDTAIMAVGDNIEDSTCKLQANINNVCL